MAVFAIFAQSVCAEKTDSVQNYKDAQVIIKFYDRTMYYPENAEENPMYVHVSIVNKGAENLRFKLADDRAFSLDFNAHTLKNTTLPYTQDLTEKRSRSQTVYFREISIGPGEEYSFIENAKRYVKFSEPSIYYLEMVFYPELYKTKIAGLQSNRLSLEVRPSPSAASGTSLPVEKNTAVLLKPEQISPDKVVEQTIVARQKSLWDQYFLYMDIEQMMLRNPDIQRRYRAASADERNRMLQNYKADLMQERIDSDIVAVPEKFSIENTSYSQTEGTVTVTEWFKYPNYREKKSYIYKVYQRDGIWQIHDYNVTNLGTE